MKRGVFLQVMGTAVAGMAAGARLLVDDNKNVIRSQAKKRSKHNCVGKNQCKGQGGCKSGDAGCKGKNSCRGKGGCAVPLRGGTNGDCGDPPCCAGKESKKDSKDNKKKK